MKPIICFYQDSNYIYSDNYSVHSCRADQSTDEFLQSIEHEFKKDLKIIQINFEYQNKSLYQDKKELYPSPSATAFVINKYEILSQQQLFAKIPSTLTKLTFDFKALEEKESFIKKVEKIKNDIAAGRLYQVNLSAPLVSQTTYTAEKIFKNLFEKFGGNYKALLPLPEYDLICFSPELFLQKQGNLLRSQPIKGSVAKNSDSKENLLDNKKEEAELSMIVDLVRNDLNRIEPEATAKVNAHRSLMDLGYIQHTFSEVSIETEKNLTEILACTFPGASISGCPKIESLKVIGELEIYKRQAYTGALGWWHNNNFCLNLTIRSFFKNKTDLYYHSGCGIVYDSNPEAEWNEFILKTGDLNVNK